MECPVCKGVLDHIEDLNTHAGDLNGGTISNLSYRCSKCKGAINVITEKQNNNVMFMRIVYRKNEYKERVRII